VSQCFGGAAVNGMQARIKDRASMALFIHSHRLNLVLTQGVSYLKAVFPNPGPQGTPPCMFSMFPCSSTPDSNEWVRSLSSAEG